MLNFIINKGFFFFYIINFIYICKWNAGPTIYDLFDIVIQKEFLVC